MASEKAAAPALKTLMIVIGGAVLVAIILMVGFRLGAGTRSTAIPVSQAPRADEPGGGDRLRAAPVAPVNSADRALPSVPGSPDEINAANGGQRQPLTPAAERDLQIAELAKSGPDTTNQLARVQNVNSEWTAIAKELGQDVKIAPWKCFRAGCYATISQLDRSKVEILGARLSESRGFLAWPGGKFRSGPVPGKDGARVEITWAFFADDSGAGTTASAP